MIPWPRAAPGKHAAIASGIGGGPTCCCPGTGMERPGGPTAASLCRRSRNDTYRCPIRPLPPPPSCQPGTRGRLLRSPSQQLAPLCLCGVNTARQRRRQRAGPSPDEALPLASRPPEPGAGGDSAQLAEIPCPLQGAHFQHCSQTPQAGDQSRTCVGALRYHVFRRQVDRWRRLQCRLPRHLANSPQSGRAGRHAGCRRRVRGGGVAVSCQSRRVPFPGAGAVQPSYRDPPLLSVWRPPRGLRVPQFGRLGAASH